MLLQHTSSRVIADVDDEHLTAEQAVETFRQLPILAEKDLQWRLDQFPNLTLKGGDLSTLMSVIAGCNKRVSGEDEEAGLDEIEHESQRPSAKRQKFISRVDGLD